MQSEGGRAPLQDVLLAHVFSNRISFDPELTRFELSLAQILLACFIQMVGRVTRDQQLTGELNF